MTSTYDEYADKAAASYLQGRMDEQGAWVEAVRQLRLANARYAGLDCASQNWVDALDALLRRMGAE